MKKVKSGDVFIEKLTRKLFFFLVRIAVNYKSFNARLLQEVVDILN